MAGVGGSGPFAINIIASSLSGVTERTLLVAVESERREVTIRIGNALVEVVDDVGTLLSASTEIGLVVALEVGRALGLSAEGGARRTTLSLSNHPHAVVVSVAVGLIAVAVLASGLTGANTSSILNLDFAEIFVFSAETEISLERAVGAADEVVAIPQAARTFLVTRIRASVLDFTTSFTNFSVEIPFADSVVVARGGVLVVIAILATAFLEVVPVALNVVVAGNVVRVDVGAAEGAGTFRDDPSTHGVVATVRGNDVLGAESFAAEGIRVPGTFRIGGAGGFIFVAEAALEGTVSIDNFTFIEISATVVEVEIRGVVTANTHGTGSDALDFTVVPVAAWVGFTGRLRHVLEFAGASA